MIGNFWANRNLFYIFAPFSPLFIKMLPRHRLRL